MALRKIKAFGQDFDVEVKRVGDQTKVKIIDNATGKTLMDKNTDLDQRISFRFK